MMNTGEHERPGGRMPYEDNTALAELRRRLREQRALQGVTVSQLAVRAKLGRTTVHQALRADGLVPSEDTVVALAKALRLSAVELLELRQRAAVFLIHTAAVGGEAGAPPVRAGKTQSPSPGTGTADGGPCTPAPSPEGVSASTADGDVGKPIASWDPHDLEVHPAGVTGGAGSLPGTGRVLSGYVSRAHDRVLADAVTEVQEGRSRMLVLVGSSSTGKTRACWEAVQPLAVRGWRLWHPYDPTRAEAALADLEHFGPRTVVWLNEAQHYLDGPPAGERIAAALHTLLTRPARGPVLILGTLWPEYARRYIALPRPGAPDPHSRVRELLAGRTVSVPDTFDREAIRAATALAHDGDRLLTDALTRAGEHGRLAQDLAGAPELLRRYQHGTPAGRALLEAAMDARRFGVGLHLPQDFLTAAATDYLTDHDWEQLPDDWAEVSYTDLADPVHGKQAPLGRVSPRPDRARPGAPGPSAGPAGPAGELFRLADYLEHHGRITRQLSYPPSSFWRAALAHLPHPETLLALARRAEDRLRMRWAHRLRLRAAELGQVSALTELADMRRWWADDEEGAAVFYRRAADAGDTNALMSLARMQKWAGDLEDAEATLREAAEAGGTGALATPLRLREQFGDWEGLETFYRHALEAGNLEALAHLAKLRQWAGDREGAETLCRRAVEAGNLDALAHLSELRQRAGDWDGAVELARQAAAAGRPGALRELAALRERTGDREGAEAMLREAADAGHTEAMMKLALLRKAAHDLEGAEEFARRAAAAGNARGLAYLAWSQEDAGDKRGAEALAMRAHRAGHHEVLARLAHARELAGDRTGAEAVARQAAAAGELDPLNHLALGREQAGDRESAEAFAREGAAAGDGGETLDGVAVFRRRHSEEEAMALVREAARAGSHYALARLAKQLEEAGDTQGAEALHVEEANTGCIPRHDSKTRWPYGLDPDGSPTPCWG
ncbi:helix-turn-helix domain-containing protein [Streptomyces sp. NPDC127112]|uniref:tetratricopeptide repeat protein n=1 Tax=Streptomyces sp. NPDC127112 TaxID=3345364 RepID=UPI00363899BF